MRVIFPFYGMRRHKRRDISDLFGPIMKDSPAKEDISGGCVVDASRTDY